MSKLSHLLVAVPLFLSIPSISQKKISLSVFTGSGISFFGGSGSTNKSVYYFGDLIGVNYMSDPYGKKSFATSFAGLQANIALPSKWILTLSTQYEQTGGRLKADSFFMLGMHKTEGKFERHYNFISINPQIVKIIFQKEISIGLHAGLDYAFKLSMGEQFDYTDQGRHKSIGYDGGNPETNDFRFTLGSSITRKRWTLDLNYKHGVNNYNKTGNGKAFQRVLHLRLMYALLKK